MSARDSARARIAVLGAGSWGTALAIQCARSGSAVHLWGRDTVHTAAMQQERVNSRYLAHAPFPASLKIAPSLEVALAGVQDILVAVPSDSFRELLLKIRPLLAPMQRLC